MTRIHVQSHTGSPIRTFEDWKQRALTPERNQMHWAEGRSACELGRIWTASGEPAVPGELNRLLDSNKGTPGDQRQFLAAVFAIGLFDGWVQRLLKSLGSSVQAML
jgi:hypothetical protein